MAATEHQMRLLEHARQEAFEKLLAVEKDCDALADGTPEKDAKLLDVRDQKLILENAINALAAAKAAPEA